MSIKIAPFNDNSFPRINRRYQHYVSEHIWCLFILQECLASQYRSKYALVQQVGKKKWRWREGGGKHCFILVNWRMSKDYSDTWHKQDKCTGVASLLFVSVWTQKVKVTAGCLSPTSSMRRKIPPELGREPEASQTVICIPLEQWMAEKDYPHATYADILVCSPLKSRHYVARWGRCCVYVKCWLVEKWAWTAEFTKNW